MSEKVTIKVARKKLHLPTIALRGLVVFPNNLVHFEVGREKSIAAVEWAMANNSNVFLVAQKSMDTTEPQQADLFSYGVVAEVKQVLRVSGDLVKVLVEGKYRAKLSALDASGDFLLSEVRPAPVRAGKADDAVETEALLRALKAGFDEYLGMNRAWQGRGVCHRFQRRPRLPQRVHARKPAVPLRGQAGCDGRGHPERTAEKAHRDAAP